MKTNYKKMYKKEYQKFLECRRRNEHKQAEKHLVKSKEYYNLLRVERAKI
ncbi:MAG: hypothetical protein U9N59_08545 [Campylobacterota bacterium]|nr:hypothetical protein [Campylobacterota bacterium]